MWQWAGVLSHGQPQKPEINLWDPRLHTPLVVPSSRDVFCSLSCCTRGVLDVRAEMCPHRHLASLSFTVAGGAPLCS